MTPIHLFWGEKKVNFIIRGHMEIRMNKTSLDTPLIYEIQYNFEISIIRQGYKNCLND